MNAIQRKRYYQILTKCVNCDNYAEWVCKALACGKELHRLRRIEQQELNQAHSKEVRKW